MDKTIIKKRLVSTTGTWEKFVEVFEYVYKRTIEKENHNDFLEIEWEFQDRNTITGVRKWYLGDRLMCEMCDGWMKLHAWIWNDEIDEEDEYGYKNSNVENPEEIISYPTSPYPFKDRRKFMTRDKEYVLGLFFKFYHDLDGAIEEIKQTFEDYN